MFAGGFHDFLNPVQVPSLIILSIQTFSLRPLEAPFYLVALDTVLLQLSGLAHLADEIIITLEFYYTSCRLKLLLIQTQSASVSVFGL